MGVIPIQPSIPLTFSFSYVTVTIQKHEEIEKLTKTTKNKLWLLKPRKLTDDSGYEHGFWDPWYDKVFGFVITAETEKKARRIAHKNGGDEVGKYIREKDKKPAWLDSKYSTCELLIAGDEPGVVMQDLWSAD